MNTDLAVSPGGRPADDSPVGHGGKNWVTSVGGLPTYIREVAHALIRNGHSEQNAIQMAVAAVKRWAAGSDGHGHKVSAKVQAAAAAAVAEWEAKKGASHSTSRTGDPVVDLAALVKGKDGKTRAVDNMDELKAAQQKANKNSSGGFNAKHPRGKKGTPNGGKFTKKNSSDQSQAAPAGDRRNMSLQQLAALQQKLHLTEPGGSSGGVKKPSTTGGGSAPKTAAAKKAAAVVSFNAHSDAQRAAYKKAHPEPPTGYSWDGDHLVKKTTATNTTLATAGSSGKKKVARVATSRGHSLSHVGHNGHVTRVDLAAAVKTEARRKMAKAGVALPDGSFPIPDIAHLKSAIRLNGKHGTYPTSKVRAHIRKRAKALGASNLIPDDWSN